MAMMCRQIIGAGSSAAGWVGLIVATATNDWVRTCDFSVSTCVRLDELGSRGLWVECVNNPAMMHCVPLNPVLNLPAYMQTARALMVIACLLGLAAMLLVLLSLTCIRLQNDTAVIKHRRALAGGVLFLVMALCGIIATVWFPVGAHQSGGLMSFGFSLYAGWVGSALCLLGGLTLLLCRVILAGPPLPDNSFYYSRQGGTAVPLDGSSHGKSARV
ncbi:claudin-11-like [Synchiropus picturatus]